MLVLIDLVRSRTPHDANTPMQYTAMFHGCKNVNFYAPNFEKVGSILVSACPFVCLSVCPCIQKKFKLAF